MKTKGEVSTETEVKAPAAAIWDIYRSLRLGELVDELLSDVLGKFEIIQGDGSVGTIAKLTFPPQVAALGGPSYLKEVFTIIDDEKRLKETQVIEGGFKDLGFDPCKVRLEIVERDEATTIIKSTVLYDVDEEHAANASNIISTKAFEIVAVTIGDYVSNQIKSAKPSENL